MKSVKAYATIPKGMMGYGCSLTVCCIVKFTSCQRDGRWCYEYMFVCLRRNKMDSELFLKFIENFPDYLSALSCTLIHFFWTTFAETAVCCRLK